MEFPYQRTDFCKQLCCSFQLLGIVRTRVPAEKMQRRRNDVIGGIKHMDAAIPEFCEIVWFKNNVPAVDFFVLTETLTHRFRVEADASGAPHIVDSILIARVVIGETACDFRPDISKILQFAFVELLEDAGLDLPLKEVTGGDDDVVAGFSGEKLGFERLVCVK